MNYKIKIKNVSNYSNYYSKFTSNFVDDRDFPQFHEGLLGKGFYGIIVLIKIDVLRF